MTIAVLLSAGRHPVSGRPCPVPVELQAIRLARMLGGEPYGLHAGPDSAAVVEALGHGLGRLMHLRLPPDHDPLASLLAAFAAATPDIILAGRRGRGGEDSGLLPYRLAHALGMPLIADAVALTKGVAETLVVEQALAKGARRRVVLRAPALVTVHPAAPPPLPFAFAQARRGIIDDRPGVPAPQEAPAWEERPYRPRPKAIGHAASGAGAAARLKAATEVAAGKGRLLVDPAPDEAAAEILAFLRKIGVGNF